MAGRSKSAALIFTMLIAMLVAGRPAAPCRTKPDARSPCPITLIAWSAWCPVRPTLSLPSDQGMRWLL